MSWFDFLLLVVGVFFWVGSHRTDDLVVAYVRLVVGIALVLYTTLDLIIWAFTHFVYVWI